MKPVKKGEFTGSVIGLLCVYVILGVLLHFVFGYDLLNSVRILATVTIVMLIVTILVIALVWLLFFVTRKIKR